MSKSWVIERDLVNLIDDMVTLIRNPKNGSFVIEWVIVWSKSYDIYRLDVPKFSRSSNKWDMTNYHPNKSLVIDSRW